MNQAQAAQLLKESILMPGSYSPSTRFMRSRSVALEVNEKPILLLGWEEDQESHEIADRLISNPYFKALIEYEYGTIDSVKKTIVENGELCLKASYNCITKSEQGFVEEGHQNGELVAIVLEDNKALGFGMSISNGIMQCFYPDALALSVQVEFNDARV